MMKQRAYLDSESRADDLQVWSIHFRWRKRTYVRNMASMPHAELDQGIRYLSVVGEFHSVFCRLK